MIKTCRLHIYNESFKFNPFRTITFCYDGKKFAYSVQGKKERHYKKKLGRMIALSRLDCLPEVGCNYIANCEVNKNSLKQWIETISNIKYCDALTTYFPRFLFKGKWELREERIKNNQVV